MTDIVSNFIEETKAIGTVAFDIEHRPDLELHKEGFDLHGCSFSNGRTCFYVKSKENVKRITSALFPLKEITCCAFNGKYDIQCLMQSGWATCYPERLVDPMIGLNLLDDNKQANQLGLKENIFEIFGHRMMTFEQAYSFGMDSPQFTKYACDDSEWEFKLWDRVKSELEHQKLLRYFMAVPAISFFADVETAGVLWDLSNARTLMREYVKVRDLLEEEIYADLGMLNLNSPKQLAQRLFVDLGYPTEGLRKTDGGDISTDSDNMELLSHRYPICKKIVKFRTASKMLGTYIVPLSHFALSSKDQRVHPKFWLVSATGRTRCDSPNLQNIPAHLNEDFKHLDIRKMFIARPGYTFVVADFSQVELRIMAHFSKDPKFLAAFRDWQCTACNSTGTSMKLLHSCPKCGVVETDAILANCPACKAKHVPLVRNKETRKIIGCAVCQSGQKYEDVRISGFWHGLDFHQITADKVSALNGDRQAGKTCNFELIFCGGARKMAATHPEFSVDQWQVIIDEYFQEYTGVKHFHNYIEQILHSVGQMRDVFGRLRRIPKRVIKASAKHALNQLVNFPIQGSAAGMIQLASTRFRQEMIKKGYWMKDVIVVNSVHDETDMEVRDDLVEEVKAIVQEIFENNVKLEVPIRVDISTGKNWQEAKG